MKDAFRTPKEIENLKAPKEGQIDYFDKGTPGLAARVSHKKTTTFVYLYRYDGKLRRETLGRFAMVVDDDLQKTLLQQKIWGREFVISLATARSLAQHIRGQVGLGVDPRVERDKAKATNEQASKIERAEIEKAKANTYHTSVENFIEMHARAKKDNKTWRDQRRLLLTANTEWHERPITSISLAEIHDALDQRMAAKKPYAANRTHAALSTFYKWLHSRDRVPENPMLRVQRPFDGEKARERVWSDDEIKAIWSAADELDYFAGPYLRLLLLLGQRRNEVAGMRWSEIDLDAATWTLPAERSKSPRKHTFPLPLLAVRILKGVRRVSGNPFVFPGRGTRDGELGPLLMGTKIRNRVKKVSGIADFTFHDARRTFRTGLDKLQVPPHVKDECLNHARRGVGDRHYSQYDYLDEQREAFDAWSKHIEGLVYPKGVVGLHG